MSSSSKPKGNADSANRSQHTPSAVTATDGDVASQLTGNPKEAQEDFFEVNRGDNGLKGAGAWASNDTSSGPPYEKMPPELVDVPDHNQRPALGHEGDGRSPNWISDRNAPFAPYKPSSDCATGAHISRVSGKRQSTLSTIS